MADIQVGKVSEFEDPGRKVVEVAGKEIGIFYLEKTFYAYHNSCPHLDGPVCQGIVLPLTTEDVEAETCNGLGRGFSKKHTNIVCPWHGMEFDIRTGKHPTDGKFRLRKIPVRVENDHVYVSL